MNVKMNSTTSVTFYNESRRQLACNQKYFDEILNELKKKFKSLSPIKVYGSLSKRMLLVGLKNFCLLLNFSVKQFLHYSSNFSKLPLCLSIVQNQLSSFFKVSLSKLIHSLMVIMTNVVEITLITKNYVIVDIVIDVTKIKI